jgi:hypothetical protein
MKAWYVSSVRESYCHTLDLGSYEFTRPRFCQCLRFQNVARCWLLVCHEAWRCVDYSLLGSQVLYETVEWGFGDYMST